MYITYIYIYNIYNIIYIYIYYICVYIYIYICVYIYIVLICKIQQLVSFHAAIKYMKQTVFKYICQIFIMSSTVFISPVHLGSKN